MSVRNLIIIAISFVALILIAVFSFINPGAEKNDYDLCDTNFDGVVDTDEIWQCYQQGNIESTPLSSNT
ncbi:MAG: hypothetical protein WC570_01935 [Patescibacteria group bacterium]